LELAAAGDMVRKDAADADTVETAMLRAIETQADRMADAIEKIRDVEQDENCQLHVLHERTDMDPSRPLIVLVHPGDANEDGMTSAFDLMQSMGAELLQRLHVDVDCIAVHRFSSDLVLNFRKRIPDEYVMATLDVTERGSALYSDCLADVAAWIIERYEVASRPEVFMSGAYSGKDDGCITAIGLRLQDVGANVVVSEYAPAEPGSAVGRWDPAETATSAAPSI
jgi:hypothetical protein